MDKLIVLDTFFHQLDNLTPVQIMSFLIIPDYFLDGLQQTF
jgi:hypothetical protein